MLRVNPHLPITPSKKQRRKVRVQLLTVRRFQYQYAFFLVSFGLIMSLVVGGLTLYVLNHNYQMLIRAALLVAPHGAIDSLSHELRLANEIITGAFVAFTIFMGVVGVKFSHSIVMPIYLIQEKMREVSRGDLRHATVRIRKSDEFQEFAETYNYLVESLRVQVTLDSQRLSELKPDVHNRDAVHIWQTMLTEKQSQLNGPDAFSTDPTLASHHAS